MDEHTNCNDADRRKDAVLYRPRKENRISMKNANRQREEVLFAYCGDVCDA